MSGDARTLLLRIALNGLTLGALYFLLGGYVGFAVVDAGGSWFVAVMAGTASIA